MAGRHVFEVGAAEFERRVLDRSAELPVLVDFWAAWCAPCRQLGPLLEREVEALAGRVELAKVDVDAEPDLGARFGVQGIPAVMAFRGGELVDQFVGARDAAFVRGFLAGLLPSAGEQALAAAVEARARGDLAAAEAALRGALGDAVVGGEAALRLAHLLFDQGRADEVAPLVERVAARGDLDEGVEDLARRLELDQAARAFGGEAAAAAAMAHDPGALEARFALAGALAGRGAIEAALGELLELVTRSRKFRDDGARRAMIALFHGLDAQSPISRDFRRRLQLVT